MCWKFVLQNKSDNIAQYVIIVNGLVVNISVTQIFNLQRFLKKNSQQNFLSPYFPIEKLLLIIKIL